MPSARPTLVFDGDCGICRKWVDYWRSLTGDAIDYRPYQEAAKDFPSIAVADFKRAMTLIEPDGRISDGAAATFRLLAHAPSHGGWRWAYEHVPGFGAVSEAAYSFLSQRRGLLAFLTRLLWGIPLEPERYALTSWLFLRGLGLIYIAAFYSLAVQVLGLVGSEGILPVSEYLTAAHAAHGAEAYWRLPTLFWFNASDTALIVATWGGVALAVLVTLGLFVRPALIALYVLYLSCTYAGQIFFNFQWDMLLLESGFLAIFLTGGSRIVVWLYRLLVFRFMLLAGVVKYVSGDPTWHDLTALDYHFWTQPLPSPLAWYAAQLPQWMLAAGVAATLVLELVLVFLIFLPRRPRMVGAVIILAFQLGIMATGSYNFFNLLTMLLCLFLFDDQALRHIVPAGLAARVARAAPHPGRLATGLAALLALLVVPVGVNLMWQPVTGRSLPFMSAVTEAVSPYAIVNPYGVFAVMTTTRPAIAFEGSNDGKTWRAYELPYMPGPVTRPLSWNIPYQPRLDWQLWFAAFEGLRRNLWIERLVEGLLEGRKPVLALFAGNPFPDRPPKYMRAELYDYRFSDPALKAKTGQPWVRQLEGLYFPQVGLQVFHKEPVAPGIAPGVVPGVVPGPAQIRP